MLLYCWQSFLPPLVIEAGSRSVCGFTLYVCIAEELGAEQSLPPGVQSSVALQAEPHVHRNASGYSVGLPHPTAWLHSLCQREGFPVT